MRASDMIEEVKRLRPSEYEDTLLLKWLGEVEWSVFREIIQTHEGGEHIHFEGLHSAGQELLVPESYGSLYKHWLCAKIDENNQETGRYNNSAALFMTAWSDYANYYNRTHMPLQRAQYIKVVG